MSKATIHQKAVHHSVFLVVAFLGLLREPSKTLWGFDFVTAWSPFQLAGKPKRTRFASG